MSPLVSHPTKPTPSNPPMHACVASLRDAPAPVNTSDLGCMFCSPTVACPPPDLRFAQKGATHVSSFSCTDPCPAFEPQVSCNQVALALLPASPCCAAAPFRHSTEHLGAASLSPNPEWNRTPGHTRTSPHKPQRILQFPDEQTLGEYGEES
jgi:hypothetical protein